MPEFVIPPRLVEPFLVVEEDVEERGVDVEDRDDDVDVDDREDEDVEPPLL